MAFISISVYGNQSFGGFLSMDKSKSVKLEDDDIYEIEPGPHLFEIHSTTDAMRKAGARQSAINSFVGSGVTGVLSEMQAQNAMGDTWSFEVFLNDNELLQSAVRSEGTKIVGTPQYTTKVLDDEELEELEEFFRRQREAAEAARAERERAREEARNRPRRSKPKIIVGAIMSGWGALLTLIMVASMASGEAPVGALVFFLILLGVGLFLLFSGLKKKVRK